MLSLWIYTLKCSLDFGPGYTYSLYVLGITFSVAVYALDLKFNLLQ